MMETQQLLFLIAVVAGVALVITAGVVLCKRFRKNARDREIDDMRQNRIRRELV